ncbi:MAG: hypothetical protein VR64_22700 [Desulfatitalea sp. BRH_c12]|nr:MAG: hypothetical protein VR64_22700 [Desulfatitalea sp. BRH_c12]
MVIFLLVLVAVTLGIHYYYVRRPLPVTTGEVRVHGIQRPVEVLRDTWGVAHVYAQSNHDLLFAQGFVHAQDRLWQMALNRRVAAGRLSEIFGEQTIALDRLLRTLGLMRAARAELADSSPEALALLRAYAAGVNAFIDAHSDRLPLEFTLLGVTAEHWRPEDSIGWAKVMALMGSGGWQEEWVGATLAHKLGHRRARWLLGADWPLSPAIWSPGPAIGHALAAAKPAGALDFSRFVPALGGGSNNWVVHGSKSDTGAPLLANDMHLDVKIPSIWYEMHLSGGDFDVIGLSMPGSPLIVAGHNQAVAWGITFAYIDNQDLFLERFDPARPGRYLHRGNWKEAERREEIIQVKGRTQPVVHTVVSTLHGPVLTPLVAPPASDMALALQWSAHTPGGLLSAILGMNRARNVAEFKEAALDWSDPSLNLVCADRSGDIGYVLAGRVPDRPQNHGFGPFAGWTGDHDWRGYLPSAEKVAFVNPARGYIATANNRLTADDRPQDLSNSYRAARIDALLSGKAPVSMADCRDLQGDFKSLEAERFIQALGSVRGQSAISEDLLVRLRAWDGSMAPQSTGGAIYEVFFQRLLENTFRDDLQEAADLFFGKGLTGLSPLNPFIARSRLLMLDLLSDPTSVWFDDVTTETREHMDKVLEKSLNETAAFLTRTLGPDPAGWRWGRLHQIVFKHPLSQRKPLDKLFDIGPFESGGHLSTVWQSTAQPGMDFRYNGWTVSNRHIYDLQTWDNSLGAIVPGQSGQPASPHYKDQVSQWRNAGHHPLYYLRDQVRARTKQRLVLVGE